MWGDGVMEGDGRRADGLPGEPGAVPVLRKVLLRFDNNIVLCDLIRLISGWILIVIFFCNRNVNRSVSRRILVPADCIPYHTMTRPVNNMFCFCVTWFVHYRHLMLRLRLIYVENVPCI